MANRIDDEMRRNRTEHSPTMSLAHEKAEEVLKNTEYSIQETEFISVYGSGNVAADIDCAARLEKKFENRQTPEEKKSKETADILEAIVLMQSELNEWLGNARTLKTSRYDDYINKVDMIAEWSTPEEGSRVLAMAVDVTFGTKKIQKKLEAIKNEIDSGKLGSVKYFKDERGDFVGTRNNIPRTVIGVSQKMVEELADLWVNKKNKELSRHPIQYLFIEEIEKQLDAMQDYADEKGNSDAVYAYKQALAIVRPLLSEKRKFKSEELEMDSVAREIDFYTKETFRLEDKKQMRAA